MIADIISYNGYYTSIDYRTEDKVYYGHIWDIIDLISFEADSVSQAKEAFKDAVDDYLETCVLIGIEPGKAIKRPIKIQYPISF